MIPLSVDLFLKIDLRRRRPSSMTLGRPLVRVGWRARCLTGKIRAAAGLASGRSGDVLDETIFPTRRSWPETESEGRFEMTANAAVGDWQPHITSDETYMRRRWLGFFWQTRKATDDEARMIFELEWQGWTR
jgi:hypothetical protein